MDMSGSERIEAPVETVWQALNDPDILRQAIPGCESL
ncbi:MAG: SRPBCC domain-containing protein, partial [Allorhizobium sp.]